SNLFFRTGLNSINAQQSDLVHLYKQVGSGKRMVTPSDDPLAAAQAINVSQTLAMGERYAANRKVAGQNLGMQENVLNTVTLQLQDVKTQLVNVGNGTLSDVDRATLAEVLQGARDALLNLANSTDGNGQYLFSGSKGNTPAFSETGTYIGDSSQRLIQVDQTRQMATADLGIDIFSRAAPGTVGFVTIPGENTGTGAFGKTLVSNPNGTAIGKRVAIKFLTPETETDPATYQVMIDGEPDPTIYDYTNPGKLLGGAFGVTLDLEGDPAVNDTFTLIPMASSYSVAKNSSMSVANVQNMGSQPFTITFDGTNYSLVNSDPGLSVSPTTVDGQTVLEVTDGATTTTTKVALYGTPTAGSSVTIEPGDGSVSRDELNLFATLDDLIATLKQPTDSETDAAGLRNAINSALQRVDVTYNNVLSVRSSAGTRLNEIDALQANGSANIMEYKNQLSQLEDLDYYTAITQLQLRTTALEAAAMAFQKIQNTSLFNLNARG